MTIDFDNVNWTLSSDGSLGAYLYFDSYDSGGGEWEHWYHYSLTLYEKDMVTNEVTMLETSNWHSDDNSGQSDMKFDFLDNALVYKVRKDVQVSFNVVNNGIKNTINGFGGGYFLDADEHLVRISTSPEDVTGVDFEYWFNILDNSMILKTIHGSPADDLLNGNGDSTEILALDGNDTVFAAGGDDTVEGNEGNDTIYGGEGNDVLYGDLIDNLEIGGNDSILGEAGNDTIKGGAGNDFLSGGTGDDDVLGDDGNDTIYGNEGNDRLVGNFGNDFVSGAAGNDTVRGNAGDDTLFGGGGFDDVRGGDGNDSITGSGGNDTVVGDAGNDTVLGESGNDKLYGSDGNDLLIGGTGGDALLGGAGIDVFTFLVLADSTASSRDNIRDFVHGEDMIDVRGLGFDGLLGKGAVGAHELKIAYSASSDRTYVRDSASSGFEFYLSGDHRADLSESDFLFV